MKNPYFIEAPACISFSGGRTSAFMLRQILDAHGGSLPDDIIPCFANTGLEHAATYEFIQRIQEEWRVRVRWLEYRYHAPASDTEKGSHGFVEVTPETASRKGEPFDEIIKARSFLPNPVTRFCTSELKIRTMRRFVESLGWDEFTSCVGLRADEPWRVAKLKGDVRKGEHPCAPMHAAGHTIDDVHSFWAKQPFRLEIPPHMGNCVGCFLKGKQKLYEIAREAPEYLAWWSDAEQRLTDKHGRPATFRNDRPPYRIILQQATQAIALFGGCEDETQTCFCHD